MKTKLSAVFLLLLTACIWGFAFVAQVVGGETVGPFWFNAIRFFIGGVTLIPVILLFEKDGKAKKSIVAGIAAGAILFTAANLQNLGINMTGSSGRAGFLTALYTILVPFFARVFFRKHTGRNTLIGALLAITGLFLLLSGGMASKDTPLVSAALQIVLAGKALKGSLEIGAGDLVLIACAVAFSAHILFIDRRVQAVSPIKFSCAQFFTAGFLSFLCALFFEPVTAEGVRAAVIPLLYAGVLSSGVAYTLQVVGQKNAHPTVAAIVMSSESMFAVLGGALLLHERLSPTAYIGCAVMMAGIVLAQIPNKR